MYWIKRVFITLVISLLTFSCASTKQKFSYEEPTLSKGIERSGTLGIPIKPTNTFTATDPEVVASLKLKNLSGMHILKWDWYDPDGNLYYTTGNHPIVTQDGQFIREATVWHRLAIHDDPAELYLGDWKVSIFLDKDFIASKPFEIKPAPAPMVYRVRRQSYAVVIGISEYLHSDKSEMPNLPFADDDARAFHDMLLALGWENDHIKTLTNTEATQRNITIALESWLTKARPNDMIVLFWSGHGFPDPEDPEKVYFACYDTNPNIPATGLRMDRVREILEERNAKNVIIMADTCHSGKLVTRGLKSISITPYVEKIQRDKDVPKGWIFMVGADADRNAIEHSSWSNGAFTHCLLDALSGSADGFESIGPMDGIVSMGELRAYLESVMPNETQKVLGVAKRPIITTSTGDPEIWNLSLIP